VRNRHDVIAVGASAGGVEALRTLVSRLPADLDASVLIVLHVPSEPPSALAEILDRAGPLPAAPARDNEPLERGRIYVAPPNRHLLVRPGRMRVVRGPRENNQRPAIDPLFRTAAAVYGPRAVGVILTGTLDDGAAGARSIRHEGGVAIVQDPDEALYPGMPLHAIAADQPQHVLPLEEIARLLAVLAAAPMRQDVLETTVPDPKEDEALIAAAGFPLELEAQEGVEPSPFGCPECGGVLWDVSERDEVRYRCRVGHAYAAESLDRGQTRVIDAALWSAVRALEERASLARRMAERLEGAAAARRAERHRVRGRKAEEQAAEIRKLLLQRDDALD
jgi:two-component system chemotaxis response regulator CheB